MGDITADSEGVRTLPYHVVKESKKWTIPKKMVMLSWLGCCSKMSTIWSESTLLWNSITRTNAKQHCDKKTQQRNCHTLFFTRLRSRSCMTQMRRNHCCQFKWDVDFPVIQLGWDRKPFLVRKLLAKFHKTNSLTWTVISSFICTSPLAVLTTVKTARFRQKIHFYITQVLFAGHVHRRAGVDKKLFGKLCKQALIFRKWE